jgi:hypothetical protein
VARRTRMLTIAAAAFLVCCALLVSWMAYRRSSESALNHSLEVLLVERLKVSYRIERSALSPYETDASGLWWIVLSEPSKQDDLSQWNPILGLADEMDQAYYRTVFADGLSLPMPLDNFKLLRGETALGAGSICEQLPCDIDVLVQPGTSDMFVMISKI